jgi:hypothetical protein
MATDLIGPDEQSCNGDLQTKRLLTALLLA